MLTPEKLKWFIKVHVYNDNVSNIIALLQNRKKNIIPLDRLLDMGCNDGAYTKLIAQKLNVDYEHCYGVDYNEAAVEVLPGTRFFFHDLDCLKPLPFEALTTGNE